MLTHNQVGPGGQFRKLQNGGRPLLRRDRLHRVLLPQLPHPPPDDLQGAG